MPSELHRTTIYLSKADLQKVQMFYGQRGSLSEILRKLLHRHVERLESKTAEHAGEALEDLEVAS